MRLRLAAGGQTGLLADVGSQTIQDCFAASPEQF